MRGAYVAHREGDSPPDSRPACPADMDTQAFVDSAPTAAPQVHEMKTPSKQKTVTLPQAPKKIRAEIQSPMRPLGNVKRVLFPL